MNMENTDKKVPSKTLAHIVARWCAQITRDKRLHFISPKFAYQRTSFICLPLS